MIVYRIKEEGGKFHAQKKMWFIFWVPISEIIERYRLAPEFNRYYGASQYVRRWHYDKYGEKEFRIER